jgi:uncharacterized protein
MRNSCSAFLFTTFPCYNFLYILICIFVIEMTSKTYILSLLKAKKADLSAKGILAVGLFGSYARGEQTEQSDIDILVDFDPEKETFDNYMAVYEILENLFQNAKVEVVTRNGLSPYIGPKILNEVQYV